MNAFPNHPSKITSDALLDRLRQLVADERKILTDILHCLQEVESRMLYAEMGYSSLYEFCTEHLGYSAGSAYRRIQSMRLLKSLPQTERLETESKLESGALTLTNLSLVHSFLKAEKKAAGKNYSVEEKVELIDRTKGKSKRELEKAFATIQPAMIPQERERVITEDKTEVRFVLDQRLLDKLCRVRQLLAHVDPNLTYAQLVERLADEYLDRKDPMNAKSKTPPAERVEREEPQVSGQRLSRHIPVEVRRKVWLRDKGSCSYVDPKSQRVCGSKFLLEMDHILPFALGGAHHESNLRLRCRTHNELHRMKTFLGNRNRQNSAGGVL